MLITNTIAVTGSGVQILKKASVFSSSAAILAQGIQNIST